MSNFFDTVDPTILRSYAFWSSVLVLKMLSMAFLTGMKRHAKKAFANPEDAPRGVAVVTNDPDVERVRRAHQNDLENILPFFPIAFLFMFTNPSVTVAVNLFRVFAISRIVHTLVYAVVVMPQPSRALAFFGGLLSTIYMAVKVFLYFL